ncbi:hypothetical protein SAMN05444722_0046 [Rhodovulum sp. ES.010]|uniref:helix-turn-helix domain-containing protein n=1 Tax=Rhodovulum sp. ES.010 TaxID=1882821 RepID=UPI00092BA9FF|nr:helix-turn-helix transcriptional regulator [Rhodovulum sp. ES.010]SIN99489.1 hypothetical protein SAMN05444722_0046 [Rhodovulum sp. ES.010]
MSEADSPTADFLSEAISTSGRTQREIAHRSGFTRANVISMMKHGEMKVPIERIPDLADACGVDPKEFARVAIAEYHPEIMNILRHIFGVDLGNDNKSLERSR